MTTTPTPTPDYKSAKAEAKAAKAYAKAQRPFWKKKRAWALAAVAGIVGIVVISNSGGGDSSDPVDRAVAAQKGKSVDASKPVKVAAKTILKEFDQNEAAADAKYDGKVLQVTGVVDKVDTELFDDSQYVVNIGTGSNWDVWTVNADDQSQNDVASLKKGDKITVVGEFEDGGDLGVELAHSQIVG